MTILEDAIVHNLCPRNHNWHDHIVIVHLVEQKFA